MTEIVEWHGFEEIEANNGLLRVKCLQNERKTWKLMQLIIYTSP